MASRIFQVQVILMALLPFQAFAKSAKTVLDLQNFSETQEVKVGKDTLVLTNLNGLVGRWYLLEFKNSKSSSGYHLEVEDPGAWKIQLGSGNSGSSGKDGEIIATPQGATPQGATPQGATPQGTTPLVATPQGKDGKTSAGVKPKSCAVSKKSLKDLYRQTQNRREAYARLCDLPLLLRTAVSGRASSKEAVASFLRKHIWGGEKITQMVKETVYKDKFKLESGSEVSGGSFDGFGKTDGPGPRPPALDPGAAGRAIEISALGIPLSDFAAGGGENKSNKMLAGRWYSSKYDPNVYLSVVEPGTLSKEILGSHKKRVSNLDSVEKKALTVLVAFRMDAYSVGYAVGTEHPAVGWSDRVHQKYRSDDPGPDGFDTIKPLVGTGRLTHRQSQDIAATFTAGFKRTHGGFKHGRLAKVNNGSHYGFVESGVVLSKLQPGLATAVIDQSGRLDMMTWKEIKKPQKFPGYVHHARQNGVPIIEGMDEKTGIPIPGSLVNRWGSGNWSGSIDRKQRALRAGACISEKNGERYLIYGYFSTATPSAMARVFQAYHCRYAMHLDMNALEHTYLATYSFDRGQIRVHNLIDEMKVLDRHHEGKVSPRFIGLSDNRDFFYLRHRKPDESAERKASDGLDSPPGLNWAPGDLPRRSNVVRAAEGGATQISQKGPSKKSAKTPQTPQTPQTPAGKQEQVLDEPQTLKAQREELYTKLRDIHGLTEDELNRVRSIFNRSAVLGQGNPGPTRRPMTRAACRQKLAKAKVDYANAEHEKACDDKYMAPMKSSGGASSCIDKFEFPNMPCEFPVVWVRADEAAEICQAVGKRLCDAHEWEGACAGQLEDPDYGFASLKGLSSHAAIKKMRRTHNARESKRKSWSYGNARRKGVCGANSTKSKGCNGGDWKRCGSNTYPVGAFPDCRSSLDVYDIHGNAAEHMNLPTKPEEMASGGSKGLGYTEMKGSWFIFDKYKAHPDFCRWRAPFWHGTRVMHKKSHHNYHLGFRCCKTLGK